MRCYNFSLLYLLPPIDQTTLDHKHEPLREVLETTKARVTLSPRGLAHRVSGSTYRRRELQRMHENTVRTRNSPIDRRGAYNVHTRFSPAPSSRRRR
jgi:hypothetical protein